MSHPLQVPLLLALIIAASKLGGAAASRLGQSAVFGEMLVGLILGPTLLNVLGWPLFREPAIAVGTDAHGPLLGVVLDLADLGVILLMFVAGLETNLDEMRRVGMVAFWSAAGGIVFPMIGGIVTAAAFGMPVFWEGVFIGTILTATSVSISAQTMMELGVLKSKEGTTILGAAVIDDVMGVVLLSMVVAFAQTPVGRHRRASDGPDRASDGRLFRRRPFARTVLRAHHRLGRSPRSEPGAARER